MRKKVFLAGVLAISMAVTAVPGYNASGESAVDNQAVATAASNLADDEVELEKSANGNPLGGVKVDGKIVYGGDPAVLVDGDTVYLYTGHDVATTEAYNISEWLCYSTKDLVNWNYEGVTMKADKASITWSNTGKDAWAGQMAKYKDKYYFYYCTWDSTSAGKQSIGVAVSDSPTGPFVDKGEPLVKGTVTEPQTSDWNDIDPTVWIETDGAGVEHRYLAWGNGKYYVCELEEDMMTVKDQNGDGQITCGTSTESADIIDKSTGLQSFTEAPWLYRRQDENGNYYGKYYMFYAYAWREQMAYATTDDLLNGTWTFGSVLMPQTATSNTNHAAVFDFQGKTYFVYHNGSLPGGSGFRRNACIAELKFDENGNVLPIDETAAGISGKTSVIYTNSGATLSHETFANSNGDGDYPYKNIEVGAGIGTEEKDSQWVITAGKADTEKAAYVSIQSENKPGLYLTVNSEKSVTLAQDWDQTAIAETAKKQTFRTVKGLADEKGVSFESVSNPGYYLTISNKTLCMTNGSDKVAATFYMGIDENDTSLRSIAASSTKNKCLKGEKFETKNITVTAFYANGTTKQVTDFTASKINTSKLGTKTITVTYTEGGVTKSTTMPVSVVAKPVKVKNLKVTITVKKSGTKIKFRFKGSSDVKGYEIRYSLKKNKGLKYMTERSSTSFTMNDTEGIFKKGKTYYFHVRSFTKFNGKRAYSAYTTVKVKAK